jgi:hypothetical protein
MRDFIKFLKDKKSPLAKLAETLATGADPAAGLPPDYAAHAPPTQLPGMPKRPLGANRKFLRKFKQGVQDIANDYQVPGQDVDVSRQPLPGEAEEDAAYQQLIAPDEEVPTQTVNPYTPWRTGQTPAVPSKTTAPPARRRGV